MAKRSLRDEGWDAAAVDAVLDYLFAIQRALERIAKALEV